MPKRAQDLTVPPGTRARCDTCGAPASYFINSALWRIKGRDRCPPCEGSREFAWGVDVGKEAFAGEQ